MKDPETYFLTVEVPYAIPGVLPAEANEEIETKRATLLDYLWESGVMFTQGEKISEDGLSMIEFRKMWFPNSPSSPQVMKEMVDWLMDNDYGFEIVRQ
jgi:hypothetical protein